MVSIYVSKVSELIVEICTYSAINDKNYKINPLLQNSSNTAEMKKGAFFHIKAECIR
jgi:hypothetical protein